MRCQLFEHFPNSIPFQALLLPAAPPLRLCCDRLSSLRQIFAHMIKVDQITAPLTKSFSDLPHYPTSPIPNTMNPTVVARSGPLRAFKQLSASHLDRLQRGLVVLVNRSGSVGQAQARLLPIQLPPFSPVFWAFCRDFNDGDQTTIRLGDDLPDASVRQACTGSLHLLDLLGVPVSMLSGSACRHVDQVMLFDFGRRLRKRMIRPEVGKHTLQAERVSTTSDSGSSREGSQEFMRAAQSIGLLLSLDQAEAGVPMKLFFPYEPDLSGHRSRIQ